VKQKSFHKNRSTHTALTHQQTEKLVKIVDISLHYGSCTHKIKTFSPLFYLDFMMMMLQMLVVIWLEIGNA
jgi:hypothetical protein